MVGHFFSGAKDLVTMRKLFSFHAVYVFLLLASVIKISQPVEATSSSYSPEALKNNCLSLNFSVSNSTPLHRSCNARAVQWKLYSFLPAKEQPSVVSLMGFWYLGSAAVWIWMNKLMCFHCLTPTASVAARMCNNAPNLIHTL